MRSPAHALSAFLVIGILAVPYVQPVLCEQFMPTTANAPGGHGEHADPAAGTSVVVADAPVPCMPTCVVAHVAPLSVIASLTMAAPDTDSDPAPTARAASVRSAPTAPPPKS